MQPTTSILERNIATLFKDLDNVAFSFEQRQLNTLRFTKLQKLGRGRVLAITEREV